MLLCSFGYFHIYVAPPCVGIVTALNGDTVNLSLLVDGSATIQPKRGVRHVTDPSLDSAVEIPGGVWDFIK